MLSIILMKRHNNNKCPQIKCMLLFSLEWNYDLRIFILIDQTLHGFFFISFPNPRCLVPYVCSWISEPEYRLDKQMVAKAAKTNSAISLDLVVHFFFLSILLFHCSHVVLIRTSWQPVNIIS